MEIQELVEKIKKANVDYYINGQSDLSDAEYDSLVQELRDKDPKNVILSKVGDGTETENKITLPNTMGSLNKIRPSNANLSELYGNNELLVMAKLDGLSMQLQYNEEGQFEAMYSRGNGFIGQIVTKRAYYMSFPKVIPVKGKKTYLFGEVVITNENFKKVKGVYKHQRNFVGGTLRPILTDREFELTPNDVKYNTGLIDFVCWDADFGFETLFENLEEARRLGFKVVSYKKTNAEELTDQEQINEIKRLKDSYEYLTDGIVVKINNKEVYKNLGKESNGLNPKGGRAIKLDLEDQDSRIGVIDHIEWNMSKRGLMIPVIVLKEPLNFDGAEVQRISGCNLKYVIENQWFTGRQIKVIRSGQVIPRIIDSFGDFNDKDCIPQICPYCGQALFQNETHLYCSNELCAGRKKAQIVEFFNALKLQDVSYETLSNLYDRGFDTYEKLLNIKYTDLIALEGYQAAKSVNVERQLNNALKDIQLVTLMSISQIFTNERTGLAETKLGWIIDAYGEENILSSLNSERDEQGNFKKLNPQVLKTIKGLGNSGYELFTKNWIEFKKLYLRLKPYLQLKQHICVDGKLKGMIFAFTQFRSQELEDLITKNGGLVKGVTKKTNVLFAAGDSVKVQTAQKYGTKIVPAGEAKEYLENLLKTQQ